MRNASDLRRALPTPPPQNSGDKNWLRSGFDLMKIKNWLGHKSLEVTQIYLDSEMHDPEEQKKLDRAGKF